MSGDVAMKLEDLPGTGIEEALQLNSDELSSLGWDDCFDVIVVGSGAAGISAALEAMDVGGCVGTSVAFIDRFEPGGTTAKSGSVMYAGGGTSLQQRLGIEDDPQAMYDYLKHEVEDVVSADTLKQFCDQSVENYDWVERNGVCYSGGFFPRKTSYPTPGHSLYYSGNELAYGAEVSPAPRGHLADGIKWFTAFGPAFVGPLIKSAIAKGVVPITQSQVKRLIVNESQEVVGVEAYRIPSQSWAGMQHRWWSRLANYMQIYYAPAAKGLRRKVEAIEKRYARRVRYQARGGVVLAAGGFIVNREMSAKYLPKYQRAMKLGTTGDSGAGVALGVSAGGVAERLSKASAWRFINPPPDWPKAALVNLKGQRYINEALYGATIGTKMMEDHQGEAVLIMDKPHFDESIANLNLKSARLVTLIQAKTAIRSAKSAQTLEDLAHRCKIDLMQLEATVREYNAAARGELPDLFGKQKSDMREIKTGPFYAINMSVGKGDITSVISLGGLRVNEETGAVLTSNDDPIKGLFAAGRTAIGVASNAYVSGLSIADGVFSGRRAGRSAVGVIAVNANESVENVEEKT